MALAFQYRENYGNPRRIALFPGAWNPPTVAHLAIALAALNHADEVVWLLPREFPHKTFEGSSFEQRCRMLCRIAKTERDFSIAVVDGGLYIEMADEAREYFGPQTEIALLCGRDAAERIANWNYREPGVFDAMLERYTLLVAGRDGDFLPHPRHAGRVTAVPMGAAFDEVSSTEIRSRMKSGSPWRHLVPAAIADLAAEIYL
jgi:nicotinate (nicotinamide) nucleotide adenylyltransferase